MNFDPNGDQLALRDAVRRFVTERYGFEARQRRLAGLARSDREMWSQYAEMGWLGAFIPEPQGGLDLQLSDAILLLQEFGRGLIAEPYLEAAVIAVRILIAAGSSAAAETLSRIAHGETLVAPALFEPGGRYAVEPKDVVARLNGAGWILDGRKILVPGGDIADFFIIAARHDGGTSLFLVPAKAEGVSCKAYRTLDGGWACDVSLSNARVGLESLISDTRHAPTLLRRIFDEASLCVGAEAIGCMEKVLEITIDYLRTRQQFGQPLAEFQVLQHRVSDLFIEIEMARSALHGGLSAIDEPEEMRQSAVSAARVRIDQAAHIVGNQGIHLHGGMGMTMEYPIGHYYRRLTRLAKTYGDTEHHLERYERLMVGA